jgi:hypothetical protein
VDEATWLAGGDLNAMLDHLVGKVSPRQTRLLAVVWCNRVRRHIADDRCRLALAILERSVDEARSEEELAAARRLAEAAFRTVQGTEIAGNLVPPVFVYRRLAARFWATQAVLATVVPDKFAPLASASLAMKAEEAGLEWWATLVRGQSRVAIQRQQLALVRCIAGNPFAPLVPRALPRHVAGLADACRAAFPAVSEAYCVLADALEELGEEQAAAHCREAQHVRGCHVIDWILQQE